MTKLIDKKISPPAFTDEDATLYQECVRFYDIFSKDMTPELNTITEEEDDIVETDHKGVPVSQEILKIDYNGEA